MLVAFGMARWPGRNRMERKIMTYPLFQNCFDAEVRVLRTPELAEFLYPRDFPAALMKRAWLQVTLLCVRSSKQS